MDSFYEIQHSDGETIQHIGVLTPSEIRRIEANGYVVVIKRLSRTLYPWLLTVEGTS